MYAQDTLGLGHVRRSATIARALLAQREDAAVLLASKSPWAATLAESDRFDVIKLPAHLARATLSGDERTAESSELHALRRAILREAVARFRPDVVLVDNEPLGFRGELGEALAAAPPGCRFVFGMRDVVDDPGRTAEQWARLGVLEALEERFDRIIVYGHPEVVDTLAVYALPDALRAKARYAGYVCAPPADIDRDALRAQLGLGDEPMVLVTGGGGEDAIGLLTATLEAAARLDGARLVLVTGPFMREEDRARVAELAAPGGHLVRERLDVIAALAACQAAATMGGYNTLVEAIMLGRRPVVIPRATHKREQLMRALAFAERDLAYCLAPDTLTTEALAGALERELTAARPLDARAYLDEHGRRTASLLLEAAQ